MPNGYLKFRNHDQVPTLNESDGNIAEARNHQPQQSSVGAGYGRHSSPKSVPTNNAQTSLPKGPTAGIAIPMREVAPPAYSKNYPQGPTKGGTE